MSRLIWAPSARQDLRKISTYLAEQNAVEAAPKILRAVRVAADRLLDYSSLEQSVSATIRAIGVGGTLYLILYRLTAADVEIVRVRHARENWLAEVEGGS